MTLKNFLSIALVVSLCACKGGGDDEGAGPDPRPDPVSGFRFRIEQDPTPEAVHRRMAGVNYLFTTDRLDGTYGPRSEHLGARFFRWPGGGIAESVGDYHRVYLERAASRDWSSFSHDESWSLEAMLSFAEQQSGDVMIVLPTKKYYDFSSGTIDRDAIKEEVGGFVYQMTRGRFGSQRIAVVEIGNEFYWGDEKIPPEDYAELANVMIGQIRQNEAYHLGVAIQGGRLGNSEIGAVAGGFTSDQKAEVDFIADHIYTRNHGDDDFLSRFRMYRNFWGDRPLLISEWNVKSKSDADLDVYAYGIEQAAPIVRVFDAMVDNNAKAAAFWAVQQNNRTSAYPREGMEPDSSPYIGGEVFGWLAGTVGMTRQNVLHLGESGMDGWAYSDEDRMIVFLAGLDAGKQQVTVEIPEMGHISLVSAIRMSGERDVPKQAPRLSGMTPRIEGNRMTFTMNKESAQELVRFVIDR